MEARAAEVARELARETAEKGQREEAAEVLAVAADELESLRVALADHEVGGVRAKLTTRRSTRWGF